MDLSKRLQLIASMVDRCSSIIDVGTDHGYIPIYLVKNKICDRAVASDINRGPVEKASFNIDGEGLGSLIDCRQGSGLLTVNPGEVQGAIIAGMGGNLIRDIIQEGLEVFKDLNFCILQPVQNAEILRKYAYESGFKVLDEELCYDEGKFYEILKVRFDNKSTCMDELSYEISPVLIAKKHPEMTKFIDYKLHRYESIMKSIIEDSEAALVRKREVESKIKRVKELLSWL